MDSGKRTVRTDDLMLGAPAGADVGDLTPGAGRAKRAAATSAGTSATIVARGPNAAASGTITSDDAPFRPARAGARRLRDRLGMERGHADAGRDHEGQRLRKRGHEAGGRHRGPGHQQTQARERKRRAPVLDESEKRLGDARGQQQHCHQRTGLGEVDTQVGDDQRHQRKQKRRVRVDDHVAEGGQPQARSKSEERGSANRLGRRQNSNHPPSTTRVWPVM
jgi:hypothetical protein